MAAVEQRHPEMAGRVMLIVVGLRVKHAAAGAHTLEIDDRLGEHRETRRRRAVGPGLEILAERHRELVVDPAMPRVPLPGIAVLRRDVCRGLNPREVLQAPRIGFADRHGSETEDRDKGPQEYSPWFVVRRPPSVSSALAPRPGPRRLLGCRGTASRSLGACSLAGGGGAPWRGAPGSGGVSLTRERLVRDGVARLALERP